MWSKLDILLKWKESYWKGLLIFYLNFLPKGYRREKTERTRDFKTMDIYRHQTKHAGILNMLNSSITTEHVLFPAFGTAEFFEFVLRNPFNHEETLTIDISDPEMQ